MIRFIPRLDIKGPNLVKGIHLEGLRVLGPPELFAGFYAEQGADEILLQDIVASLYNRNSIHEIITKIAKEVFIPITVGGGIRSLDDIRSILRAGADKVSINTAAIKNPNLVSQAAKYFGSSTIVVAIECIRHSNGQYYCYYDNGREYSAKNVLEWAKTVEELGAGEIILTSVDKEGTGGGFDLELVNSVLDIVNIPVIIHGGAGSVDHLVELFSKTEADSVSIASVLHYKAVQFIAEKLYKVEAEGNYTFLDKGSFHSKNIDPVELKELKLYLHQKKFSVRI
jgi:cyclase